MKKEIRYRCIAIVFAITHVLSVQAYDFQYNGLFYNIISETERTVALAPPPDSKLYSGYFVIPESVTQNVTGITYKVIAIGDNAFCDCSGLTSVMIPESVTTIGDDAFYGCYGLISITIPESVTTIGSSAFSSCSSLTSVTIPKGVTTIGSSAFSSCSSLTSVTIPESVTSIGSSAFSRCSDLTSITIPESVTTIGDSAFCDCSGLTLLTIPESVTTIGDDAFGGCRGLTSITIPESVTSIGSYAFSRCSGLTSITIPESVTSIGNCAFWYCSGLISVTIPESVTTIGGGAFYGCSGLTSVTIPKCVTTIGDNAFSKCAKLYEFICKPIDAPRIGGSSYDGISSWCKLYVSKGSTGYEAWSPYFAEIIEVDFGGIDAPREVAETIRIIGRNLMVENVALQGNISIYNPSGQLIRSVIPDPSSKQICIDDLDKGMYFVVLQSAGASTIHKIIVP